MKTVAKKCLGRTLRRISSFVMGRRYERACGWAEQALPLYLPRVYAYLSRQKSEHGLHSDHTAYKLIELWQMLERIEPSVILECGSGATTAVFAEYAANRPGTTLVSLDNGAEYLDETRRRLAPEVRDIPTFVHAERCVDGPPGAEVCFYAPEYRGHLGTHIDLLYVDGPYNVSPTVPSWHMQCVDAVKLLDAGYHVANVLFDNRLSSVRYLLDSAHGLRFDGELRDAVLADNEEWYVAPIRHHSWLWLRDTRRFGLAAATGRKTHTCMTAARQGSNA